MYSASKFSYSFLKYDCIGIKTLFQSARLMSSSGSKATTDSRQTTTTLRAFEEIPGPKGLPLIGNTLSFIFNKKRSNFLEFFPEMHQKYGSIFRADIGPQKGVVICNSALVEEMFRQEDKYPTRDTPIAWVKHREDLGYSTGLSSVGEEWFRTRRILNSKMLRPREIDAYVPQMNEVVTDFLRVIEKLKDENDIISDLRSKLFGLSLEMMGTVALGTRLGAIGEDQGLECKLFVEAARNAMRLLNAPDIMAYPEWLIKFYKTENLKEYERNIDVMLPFTIKRIEEKLRELEKNMDASDETGADMITYLLGREELSFNEVVANIEAMLFAAVDTTSNGMQWALYCLASNPEVQENLYQVMRNQIEPGRIPTAEDINKLSYLKCFLKESQRMFPVVFLFTRKLSKEIVLGEYKIPPNTWVLTATYILAHDPENFPDPEKFQPERWMRDSETKPAPFTFTPFGFGNRSCPGRRIADLETLLLLTRICLNYKLEHIGEKPKPVTVPLLSPEKPIQVKLSRR